MTKSRQLSDEIASTWTKYFNLHSTFWSEALRHDNCLIMNAVLGVELHFVAQMHNFKLRKAKKSLRMPLLIRRVLKQRLASFGRWCRFDGQIRSEHLRWHWPSSVCNYLALDSRHRHGCASLQCAPRPPDNKRLSHFVAISHLEKAAIVTAHCIVKLNWV